MKLRTGVIFILSVTIFLMNCSFFYPFISDDSLISLRYAQRFIEGKGLSWNDGYPVEGYSNLLWILGVSLFGILGMDLIISARIVGLLCAIATIWILIVFFRKQKIPQEYTLLGLLLLVTTPSFAIWTIGGLEQPLYVLLITLISVEVIQMIQQNSLKRVYYLSIWLGLLAVTRPDGYLFTIITTAFLLYINRKDNTRLIKIVSIAAAIPTIFLLSQLLFRYVYYHEFVPNTALVKVKITFYHIVRGVFYHVKAFFGTFVLSSLGIVLLFLMVYRKKSLTAVFLSLNILAWTSYVSLVGGDIFPAYRHYDVVLIFLVLATVLGLNMFKPNLFHKPKVRMLFAILLLINFIVQIKLPENQRAVAERWEFRGIELGHRLKTVFSDKTLVAVTAAGCIPYASGLPSIDMLGLNDYHIARHPPESFGTGPLAHELGDAEYTMKRNPDIVIFNTGGSPSFNIGLQLMGNPTFTQNFVSTWAQEHGKSYLLFFNKYGTNCGIKQAGNQLIIPGYLFSHPADTISIFSGKKLLKNSIAGTRYTLSLHGITEKKWSLKTVVAYNVKSFRGATLHKKGGVEISFVPNTDGRIESVVLEAKD